MRLLQLADLQRDRAVPVARLFQLELLPQRDEAWQGRLEHVLRPAAAGNWKRPAASVVALDFAPCPVKRDLHAGQDAAAAVVDGADQGADRSCSACTAAAVRG